MNIKIKSAGVTCLIGDDYNRVYSALKKQLTDDNAQLFTERTPGHEYLQWELPGDGWMPLSEGDPLLSQNVRNELHRKKQSIIQQFENNKEMAQRILSVPDDSYVYYKISDDGHLLIRLTAWGYKYPERISADPMTGKHTPKGENEHVRIYIVYDKKPLSDKVLFLNGFQRQTDSSGVYDIGDLPIGYQFELKVDDYHEFVKVQSGHGDILIDTTIYSTAQIKANLDGKPYKNADVIISYMEHELRLTTDSLGIASAKLPIDPNKGLCKVSIDLESQEAVLVQPVTVFSFNIVSPKEEEEKKNSSKEEIQEIKDKPQKEKKDEQKPIQELKGDESVIEKPLEPKTKPEYFKEEQQPEEEKHDDKWNILWGILIALFLLLLIAFTYLFCYGMLFG